MKYFIISIFFFALTFGLTGCKEDNNDVTGVALDKVTVTLNVGESTTVIPYPVPWDADVQNTFTWSSENTGIATVDNTGVILGVAAGETKVTCHYDSYTAAVTVTVKASN